MDSQNITLNTNSITIDSDGIYSISFSILIEAVSGSGVSLSVGVQVNGAFAIPQLVSTLAISSDSPTLTVNSIASLSEGDVLTLSILSPNDISLQLVANSNTLLTALRIGEIV